MTDEKHKARQKILGELESIRSLLDEDELEQEPPLLTTPADDEVPLVTGELNDAPAEQPDPAEDIPVLEAAVDQEDWQPDVDAEEDVAPSGPSRPEEQPGLFDREFAPEPEPSPTGDLPSEAEATPADAAGAHTRATPLSPVDKKAENPFLPKHIRDRLHANRRELLESYGQSAKTSAEAAKPSPTTDDAIVEELVKEYLPRIEAELRKRLRALLDEERASKKSSRD